MANNTLKKHMVKVGLWERTVVHGFRTSFRTWAAECTDIPREVCEMALAHTVGTGVEQAYSRSEPTGKARPANATVESFLVLIVPLDSLSGVVYIVR